MKDPREIIDACLKNDRAAQKQLYNFFARKMYGVCLRYAGNAEEAQDILQEGFIKVFSHLSTYTGSGSFEGWVRRIMVNTALEKYREKVLLYSITDMEEQISDMEDERVSFPCSEADLLALIQELPPRYRMVFNLYAIEGYTHKEIAQIMGINEGTSKSNLARARIVLQDKLKEQFAIKGKVV